MRRSWIVPVVVLALIGAGVVLVLLAHDVRNQRDTLRAERLTYAVSPTAEPRSQTATLLPSTVSARVSSTARERQWLDGLTIFARLYAETLNLEQFGQPVYNALNEGRAVLGRLTQDPEPVRASQAYNLLALLAYREAHPGGGLVDTGLVQEAITDLQTAVRLDGGNEAAKANLELILRAVAAARPGTEQQRALGKNGRTANRHGAAGGQGTGY